MVIKITVSEKTRERRWCLSNSQVNKKHDAQEGEEGSSSEKIVTSK
jgi:hypothetical protein